MQGRTEFQQQKLQTYEIRQNQYQNTWKVPLMDTILKKPLCKLLPQAKDSSVCMCSVMALCKYNQLPLHVMSVQGASSVLFAQTVCPTSIASRRCTAT